MVEFGLGSVAFPVIPKLVPIFKRKADAEDAAMRAAKESGAWAKMSPRQRLNASRWWERWLFARGAFFLLPQLLPAYILLTSVGWTLPFLPNLGYNLLYATANGAPNGAHVTSYLFVMALAIGVSLKTRDPFLGVLSAAFLVSLHEGIWLPLYYLAYGRFVVLPAMLTNVLKDFPIFSGMLVLFMLGFAKYPLNRWRLSDFKWAALVLAGYGALWFAVPHLFFGFSNWLPIRTDNLPGSPITTTQWNETPWYWDPWVNATEVVGWALATAAVAVTMVRKFVSRPK